MEGERLHDMSGHNDQTIAHWMPYWTRAMAVNYSTIYRQSRKHTKELWKGTSTYNNISVNSLPRYPMTPGLILGSGPSLDDALPYLKDFPGKIICGSSQLKACVASGVDPHYLVCLDSNKNILQDIKWAGKEWPNTVLVTHPSIDPSVLRYWKWEVKYFRPLQLQDVFFEKYYPMFYPFIEIAFLNAGCTINAELELANFLGLFPVVLAGVDFGFPDGRARHTRFEFEDGKWVKKPDGPIQTRFGLHVAKNLVPTTEEMITYKQNLFLVARTDLAQLYTSSRGIIRAEETCGFINPADYKNLGKDWPAYKDPVEIRKNLDAVLDAMGIKLVEEKGVLKVSMEGEQKNPKAISVVGNDKSYSVTAAKDKPKKTKKKIEVPFGFEKNA